MREIIALAALLAGSRMIDISQRETDYSSIFGIIITLGALMYLAIAIAERFNPNMKKWHRINPGNPTDLDEEEWKRLENPSAANPPTVNPPAANPHTVNPSAANPHAAAPKQKFMPHARPHRRTAPAEETPEEAPKKPPAMFYDSGFDETAGRRPEAEGKDEFDDIFDIKDK
ncbi:MAG: hypothetical protein HAW59_03860 [Betaproteobacteria bacterium]|nr:hypothetical protein [Betaproteobacteria bacterium]